MPEKNNSFVGGMPLLKAMSALALPQVVTYIISILTDTRLTAYFPQQPE